MLYSTKKHTKNPGSSIQSNRQRARDVIYKIYKMAVRSAMLYDSDIVALAEKQEAELEVLRF